MCDKCCKKISEPKCDASSKQKDDDSDEVEQFAKISTIHSINESLQVIGESPVKKKRQGKGKYPASKYKALKML